MTLRSPKKRPTTAPTSNRRTKTDRSLRRASLGLAVAVLSCASLGSIETQAQQPAPTANSGWNLRWRRSEKVTPQPVQVQATDVFAQPARTAQAAAAPRDALAGQASTSHVSHPAANAQLTAASQTQTTTASQTLAQVGYQQPAAYQQPVQSANAFEQAVVSRSIQQSSLRQAQYSEPVLAAPVGNYHRAEPTRAEPTRAEPTRGAAPTRLAQANDFFNNPFADSGRAAGRAAAPQSAPYQRVKSMPRLATTQAPAAGGFQLPGDPPSSNQLPPTTPPSNALRGPLSTPPESIPTPAPELPAPESFAPDNGTPDSIPLPQPALPEQTLPELSLPETTQPAPNQDSSMREFLNDPNETEAMRDNNQPPATAEGLGQEGLGQERADSPSDKDDTDSSPYQNPFDESRADRDQNEALGQNRAAADTTMIKANQLSCDEFRERIARETIDQISLDPSPPFRPDLFDPVKYQEKREDFQQRQTVRPWTSADGRVLASGRFIDLAYEQVIIETEDGQQREVPVKRLSEGDLGYLSENWGLPKECLIPQVAHTPRSWSQLTMTWKASNLCSKPRYFEEVNLERYGHTAGPWLQPVVSSAHFFANIAVLPYKMGIHPPNECQYALGYYRPGNCAPWIVPPVPISARGALAQGAAMTGAFWLVP